MRFLFLGAGAIGTYVGGSLAAAGHRVTYSEQPSAAVVIAEQGLRLTRDGHSVPVRDFAIFGSAAEALAAERPAGYDVVTCMEMLEHVPDPASVVRACSSLVKPGGWVFFSTLNRNPKAFLFAIVGAEYLLRLLPKGTHEYARFIRPSELGRWCRDAGLSVEGSRGMEYNPLTKRYSLSGDTSVNYLIACRKPA